MPELPEVEVVRLGLEPAVTGATVASVEVFDERGITRHDRAAGDFASLLTGRRMARPERRGKFIWVPLDAAVAPGPGLGSEAARGEAGDAPALALLAHLGMTGQLLLREAWARPEADRHLRVRLTLEHPRLGELAVHFVDQRTFGSLAVDRLLGGPVGAVPSQVAHIARDPMDPLFDESAVLARFARGASTIKRMLLDQTVVSGVGNIYADEALWAARIHPEQPASSLSRQKARLLIAEVRLVLAKALTEGGTSFDSQYVNVNGQAGYFAHSLNAYGRDGQPCPRCGAPVVRVAFANRSSHYCPRCQRLRADRRGRA